MIPTQQTIDAAPWTAETPAWFIRELSNGFDEGKDYDACLMLFPAEHPDVTYSTWDLHENLYDIPYRDDVANSDMTYKEFRESWSHMNYGLNWSVEHVGNTEDELKYVKCPVIYLYKKED